MHRAVRVFSSMALVISLAACSSPTSPLEGVTGGEGSGSFQGKEGLPAWVVHPEALPVGLQGQSNCTFDAEGQWDAHPDGGCWEKPGPDGWIRQQSNRNHSESLPVCGGGPGDVELIRVCRADSAFEISPCGETGPRGCGLCVRVVTCH
jgi:hypothetical protein